MFGNMQARPTQVVIYIGSLWEKCMKPRCDYIYIAATKIGNGLIRPVELGSHQKVIVKQNGQGTYQKKLFLLIGHLPIVTILVNRIHLRLESIQ